MCSSSAVRVHLHILVVLYYNIAKTGSLYRSAAISYQVMLAIGDLQQELCGGTLISASIVFRSMPPEHHHWRRGIQGALVRTHGSRWQQRLIQRRRVLSELQCGANECLHPNALIHIVTSIGTCKLHYNVRTTVESSGPPEVQRELLPEQHRAAHSELTIHSKPVRERCASASCKQLVRRTDLQRERLGTHLR